MILVRYGSTDPIPFKTTLDGDAVTGLVFATNDVQLSLDGGTFVNIGLEVTEIALGWYIWTPSTSSQTQAEYGLINVKDISTTAVFNENGITLYMGGDPVNGRYTGT